MTKPAICMNPVRREGEKEEQCMIMVDFDRADYINQLRPYSLEVELTSKCYGSCLYCYSTSTASGDLTLPTERALRLVDEARDMGIQMMIWYGGDPHQHPDWFKILSYAGERGMRNVMITSGLLSKKDVREMMELGPSLEAASIHIDTIVQEDYDKVHADPRTMEMKMQGYRNLLDAGYPPEQVMNCITLTRPIINSVPTTIDWYVDEMGAKSLALIVFKYEGMAKSHKDWEPTMAEIKNVFEYRAKKLGEHWLRFGAMDAVMYYCRSTICVTYEGNVIPCPCTRPLVQGNIYTEPLADIFERGKDTLLYNFEIKGACGTCDNKDLCFGCRANGFLYYGDVTASDPKCWLNPEAQDAVLSTRN